MTAAFPVNPSCGCFDGAFRTAAAPRMYLALLFLFCVGLFPEADAFDRSPGRVRCRFRLAELSEDLRSAVLEVRVNGDLVFLKRNGLAEGDLISFFYAPGDEIAIRALLPPPETRKEASYLTGFSLFRIFSGKPRILLSRVSAGMFALTDFFQTPMSSGKSFLRWEPYYPEGEYRVTLLKSYIAPDDAVRCGAVADSRSFPERLPDALADLLLRGRGKKVPAAEEKVEKVEKEERKEDAAAEAFPSVTYPALKERMYSEGRHFLRSFWEKLDHRVMVFQNGKKVFDTDTLGKARRPQGNSAVWGGGVSFSIRWKPGDMLSIRFSDANRVLPDTLIFSRSSDGPFGISMLNGEIHGGGSSCSGVVFKLEYRKD